MLPYCQKLARYQGRSWDEHVGRYLLPLETDFLEMQARVGNQGL